MKTRIWFALLALSVFMVPVFLTGCSGPEKKILGKWKLDTGKLDTGKLDTMENFYFTFMENEELNVNDEIFMKYNFTSDNKLVLGQEAPVPFSIKGNTMFIYQEGQTITLTKTKRPEKKR